MLAAASKAVGFFAVAEPVDEWAQLPQVPDPPRNHHLLLDDVSLRKVCPSLWQRHTNEIRHLICLWEGHCSQEDGNTVCHSTETSTVDIVSASP